MSIKSYEISNNSPNNLEITLYHIDKRPLGKYIMSSTPHTIITEKNTCGSTPDCINNNDLNKFIEFNKTSDIVNNLKSSKYKDIYINNNFTENKSMFFLIDDQMDGLNESTAFKTKWNKEEKKNYDYFNIPMNIFVPIKSSQDTLNYQCNENNALQEINTNIKMINNFYTNRFIPTTIKYTYSNKCNILPLDEYEVNTKTIYLTKYSTDHDIIAPGAIKYIERNGNKITIYYYKSKNLIANSYTNDIISISTPTNINLYQATSNGSLIRKNVDTRSYYIPIASKNPDNVINGDFPPSLPYNKHYGLYSYADDNKLKLTCKDNDFLAGYSLKYNSNNYIITPYCIHYSSPKVEIPDEKIPIEEPLHTTCKREEYLGHIYEETKPGTEFIIKDDITKIHRYCNKDGTWDKPRYFYNCGVIDGTNWYGGEKRTIENNGNQYTYICKGEGSHFIPTLIDGKCSTDNGEYNIGESYSTSCAIGEEGVKYYKCAEGNFEEINNCKKVCMYNNKKYNTGESYSSSCDIGEEGSKIYTCNQSGTWNIDNKCNNTTIDSEETSNNKFIIILIIIGIFLVIILIIVIIANKVKKNKQSKQKIIFLKKSN